MEEEFVDSVPSENIPEEAEEEESPSMTASFGFSSWLQDALETLLLAVIMFLVINTLTGRYQVHGQSMEPSLHDGEYILASKVTYHLHSPERGDIVVLDPPAEQSKVPYVKRIIGLPGDSVEIHDGRVWINGIAIYEPYINAPPAYSNSWHVPEGSYFVLGDNRNHSSDSHAWGMLPRSHLVAKAIFCYWPPESWGPMPHYTYPELAGEQ